MPCRSDYMEPSQKESQLQETAKLLVYVLETLSEEVPQKLKNSANSIYCTSDYVPELCAKINSMPDNIKEAIVYDAHSPLSRSLANWWDMHQEADKLRDQLNDEKKLQEAIKEKALKKLTKKERVALGINY